LAAASLLEKILIVGLIATGAAILGLGTYLAIEALINLNIPLAANKELVPVDKIPSQETSEGMSDKDLNKKAEEIAGETLKNAKKEAKDNSGEGQSGRSGQNAQAKMNAGNGLIQAANDLPGKHPLREKLKTKGKRYIEQAKADNHPSR
jgi:hypothetical protein